ncbi:hypothetical protein CHARACLAT_026980 [Characodon lateralis]|uniref:Uncharacterized protein n=1 Tax=Characodon lateralis TaxID=208331 RepID=A0ABU7EMU8_9TELE|nr:hypothetical protein [Characodon lateralis]
MKLERFFSMLAPTQSQHHLLLSSLVSRLFCKRWDFRLLLSCFRFLLIPSLLPTDLDSSSAIIRFLFLYYNNDTLRVFALFLLLVEIWISAERSRFYSHLSFPV